MDLFIGNLPSTVDVTELQRLFAPYGDSVRFTLTRKKEYDGYLNYGLVSLQPDSLARRAVRDLDMAMLRGRPLVVRKFIYRSCANERRSLDWRQKPWRGKERRTTDRRGRGAAYISS